MPEDKEEAILADLKAVARENKNAIIKVEFKVHEGKINLGEILEIRRKLG